MRYLPKLLLAFLLVLALIPACEVENCPPNALAYAVFTIKDGTGADVEFSDELSVIGIMVLEDGEEVVDTLVNEEDDVSSLSLPLSYSNVTKFVLVYADDAGTDTITITHRNIPYYFNVDCGTMMYYEVEDLQTTYYQIDSVVIVNPNIDNYETENFYIYYPPVDE